MHFNVIHPIVTKRPILFWDFDETHEDIFSPNLDGFVQSVRDSLIEAFLELKAVSTPECDLNKDAVIGSVDPKIVAVKRHLLHRMLREDLEPIVLRDIEDIQQRVAYNVSDRSLILERLPDDHINPNQKRGRSSEESSTKDPLHPASNSTFIPNAPFPSPLNETWAITKGADLIWTPIPFERSFQMAYTRTRYGTGYYIYDQFVPGTAISHPLKSWDESSVPERDVLNLVSEAGTDISPKEGFKEFGGTVDVPAASVTPLANLKGKATIRSLTFSIPKDEADAFTNVHLRVTWDGRSASSIDVPLALFYGAGSLYNRPNREYLVKAFPVNIRFANDRVYFACYFPMPYFRSARIELVGAGEAVHGVQWNVHSMPLDGPESRLSYFHATYKDFPKPVAGDDLVLLDTRAAEGSNQWSGSVVGTSFIFSHNADLRTLEGDPRMFFDDSRSPQVQGTGTEEWGGGGDYWGG
ncbi:MAG: hypothetical protein JWM43_935 [Acidobacteriaceae bacterium]|nr:hypothetical protein [Acidobacteriaceae bacterium]